MVLMMSNWLAMLVSDAFPEMRCVLRCGVHTVVGSMKMGWTADATAQRVTQMVVQEVAKYIRSSLQERHVQVPREKASCTNIGARSTIISMRLLSISTF